MRIVDTHVHLDEVQDSEGALGRAREAGIQAIVAVGMDRRSNERTLSLAQKYPGFVYPAVGYHPWRLQDDDLEANFSLLETELPHCLAMGEVGLDWAIDTPRERQEEIFARLLVLAAREKKPILLHARRAWAECLQGLRVHKIQKAVFHWYSGPLGLLPQIFEEGYLISATPAAAYSEKHRQAIQYTPLPRLLLETDAPEVYRGKASEPKDVLITLYSVSDVKKVNPEEIGEQIFKNTEEFFGQPFCG